jgi:hypothetical protein
VPVPGIQLHFDSVPRGLNTAIAQEDPERIDLDADELTALRNLMMDAETEKGTPA